MTDSTEEWYTDLRLRYQFDDLLAGGIEDSWDRCSSIWRERGRIEDKPFGVRHSRYAPWWGKYLAQEFASKFYADCSFLIGFVDSRDEFEQLAAIELLGYMAPHFNLLPVELEALTNPLPNALQREIESDWISRDLPICSVATYVEALSKL